MNGTPLDQWLLDWVADNYMHNRQLAPPPTDYEPPWNDAGEPAQEKTSNEED